MLANEISKSGHGRGRIAGLVRPSSPALLAWTGCSGNRGPADRPAPPQALSAPAVPATTSAGFLKQPDKQEAPRSNVDKRFVEGLRRRLNRPARRIKCALSRLFSDPVKACYHMRNPPALWIRSLPQGRLVPFENTRSRRSGPRNHSCQSADPDIGASLSESDSATDFLSHPKHLISLLF